MFYCLFCISVSSACTDPFFISECSQDCVKINGQHTCECKKGYQKEANNPFNCMGMGIFHVVWFLKTVIAKENHILMKQPVHIAVTSVFFTDIESNKTFHLKFNSFSSYGFYFADVNECTTTDAALKNLCGVNTKCNNTQGSYTCICDQYYIPDLDGLACSGILWLYSIL